MCTQYEGIQADKEKPGKEVLQESESHFRENEALRQLTAQLSEQLADMTAKVRRYTRSQRSGRGRGEAQASRRKEGNAGGGREGRAEGGQAAGARVAR